MLILGCWMAAEPLRCAFHRGGMFTRPSQQHPCTRCVWPPQIPHESLGTAACDLTDLDMAGDLGIIQGRRSPAGSVCIRGRTIKGTQKAARNVKNYPYSGYSKGPGPTCCRVLMGFRKSLQDVLKPHRALRNHAIL